ncbi:MAG: hypothetical protein EOM20_18010 [Spartobacteria bacterium]|nr:hypothetical protein [Spartobacteria bacterium]
MKKLGGTAILCLLAAAMAQAGVPQPSAVVYGIVRDAFGYPYDTGAAVVALAGGNEVARYAPGGLLPGVANYRISLDMDSGGNPYADYAVHVGAALEVVVEIGGSLRATIPDGGISAPGPGGRLRLDLVTGTDSDGDGLPDEWEQQLIDQSGGQLSDLSDVMPEDDFDGDGMSNREEFQAGSFAFLVTDVLAVEAMEQVDGARIKVRFPTSSGRTYRLMAVHRLVGEENLWMPLAFATEALGDCRYQALTGDGAYQTVFVDTWPDASSVFIRLGVE